MQPQSPSPLPVEPPAGPEPANGNMPPPQPAQLPVEPVSTGAPSTPLTSPADSYVGLTGSQLQPEKKRMPSGVYIIAGFALLGVIIGFFDDSQNSGIYTFAMLLDLLLAIGLLFGIEVARRIIVWLQAITLVLAVVSLLMLIGLQQQIQLSKANYETALSKINQNSLTSTEKAQLNSIQSAIAAAEKRAGKAIAFTYAKLGVTAVATVGVIVYLTRPKVKEAFHDLEA